MTDHDITIQNADGTPAAVVTITSLGAAGGDAIADHARAALAREFGERCEVRDE